VDQLNDDSEQLRCRDLGWQRKIWETLLSFVISFNLKSHEFVGVGIDQALDITCFITPDKISNKENPTPFCSTFNHPWMCFQLKRGFAMTGE